MDQTKETFQEKAKGQDSYRSTDADSAVETKDETSTFDPACLDFNTAQAQVEESEIDINETIGAA
jgi:hypothetical protein